MHLSFCSKKSPYLSVIAKGLGLSGPVICHRACTTHKDLFSPTMAGPDGFWQLPVNSHSQRELGECAKFSVFYPACAATIVLEVLYSLPTSTVLPLFAGHSHENVAPLYYLSC